MSLLNILGVDPSLNNTGWALISFDGNMFKFIKSGVITSDLKKNTIQKISNISNKIRQIADSNKITEVAMEETIVNVNPSSSLKLGMVRGAVISVFANLEMEILEYLPKVIKKAVVGKGNADKEQVRFMIAKMMKIENIKSMKHDEVDAVAIAVTHCFNKKVYKEVN